MSSNPQLLAGRLYDDSMDLFGVIVTCGCIVLGLAIQKPEWPMWMTTAGTVTAFLAITSLLPGRRLRKTKSA